MKEIIPLKMKKSLLVFILFLGSISVFAQGVLKGKITNPVNNEPVSFANVLILETDLGAITDEDGNYEISNVPAGLYNVRASFVGFKPVTKYEVRVTLAKAVQLDFELVEDAAELNEVVVSSEFSRSEETPLSVRKLNSNEIERYPGGNRDISRVIQALPGVASTPSFRNDILIRGGAPNENKFFVDEIEVPVINHFSTQGSSGGPVGILNVNLIKNVDLIAGGFPANRMNALSSFFEVSLKEGRRDQMFTQLTLGASELTLSNEGPIGDKTTYLLSARRSYLQGLFKLLQLPFLPTFNDFQLKTTTKLNDKTELTFLGIGAVDKFVLNEELPDGESQEERENRQYLLGVLPVQEQWNYATGFKLKRFRENGYWTFVLSRNMLNNRSYKFANNDESSSENLLFDYLSQESENKFRAENSIFGSGYTLKYGVNYEYARYFIDNFDRSSLASTGQTIDVNSTSHFNSYGAFVSGSKYFDGERLLLTGGIRMDGSDFGKTAQNPLNQIAPRLSLSYQLGSNLYATANAGIYYQKPPYTVLGYKNNEGDLVNQENDVRFIRSSQLIGGIELLKPEKNRRFTAEAFYKHYSNYPSSVRNGIALANLGADFGVIGNEPVESNAKGRAYGLELLAQQRLFNDFYGIAAVTLVRSEFTNPNTDGYAPSSWDNRFIISLTAGKRFGKNWELGARWRFLGGTPYTPYDLEESALISNWDLRNTGILDYDQINAVRLPAFHQLDLRLDKKYYFKNWNLNWYVDIQNAYNFEAQQAPILIPVRDDAGSILVNPNDPSRYQLKLIENTAGSLLPSVGIIVEF
ncbi:outer membrane receptor protein involved in Fe transport [Algoriphagus zhangzhouensis]|uniref:Outer membrane receptor proteins, mostly Fe transport n=2 Tax=Algoriphagus zhangzhouensis TaxID=1073327 RepID=A0A1M7ZB90_9BACT|nr:outer membrane receptor protein involved in Fe transport [Algoriphagus zhangzhouensis]SHO62133.1 Outer membrane receptor proteins, mostly Fe transport [Algoriphagus zhangzhouensis]